MSSLFSSFADIFSKIGTILSAVFDVWFIIFPPLLYFLFKEIWMMHIWGRYGSELKWVLLEIIPPRDIEKSPLPMESIFTGFAGTIKTHSTAEEYIKGEFPVSFSLEIASLEGVVHFYVRTQAGFRHLVEAHFYAQYPTVEIVEVEDYVELIPKSVPNKDWDLWGVDFKLFKPDLYPIKTFKNFEETITGKMIDPLAGLIETMGKLGPGQYLWLQYIITPIKEDWEKKFGQAQVDNFLGKVKEEKQGIFMRVFHDFIDVIVNLGNGLMGKEVEFAGAAETEKKEEAPIEFRLTPGEKKVLEALQANLGKPMFRTRMRHVYVGKRENFNKPVGVSGFIGGIKQFNDFNLNSLVPDDLTKTYAGYIFTQERLRYRQRRLLHRYITRDQDPFSTLFMFSSEELATIFHIPDMQVLAPSLTRIAAKRGSAPSNLPLQDLEI